MTTIVRLNGTHGSGKSTVAAKIISKLRGVPIYADGDTRRKKPLGYSVQLIQNKGKLFVVGPYETPCGGCDAIQPFADIWPRVLWGLQTHDHALFEGALVSTTFGAIGAASEAYGDSFVWAFMDTPKEKCRERVNQRRAIRGAPPLTDFFNIDAKWDTITKLKYKLQDGLVGNIGPRVTATIDHTHPVKDVMSLFGVKLTKEPT